MSGLLDYIGEELPYWDHIEKELKGSQKSKARKFVRDGLVRKVSGNIWVVLPIKGYNKRSYTVEWKGQDVFECNCQFHQKTGEYCSHILAVILYETGNIEGGVEDE